MAESHALIQDQHTFQPFFILVRYSILLSRTLTRIEKKVYPRFHPNQFLAESFGQEDILITQ